MRIWSSRSPRILLVEVQNGTPTSEMLRFRSAVYWKYTYITVYVHVCACIYMHSFKNYFYFTLFFTAPVNQMEVLSRPQVPGAQVGGCPVGEGGALFDFLLGVSGVGVATPLPVAVESIRLQASIMRLAHHCVSAVFLGELVERRLDDAILQAEHRGQARSVEEGCVSWTGTAAGPGPGTTVTDLALRCHVHQGFSSAMGTPRTFCEQRDTPA